MNGKKYWYFALLAWFLICGIGIYWSAAVQLKDMKADLINDGHVLHRMVSQRADQHDAHLTGLSSLASVNREPLLAPMASLSETIQQFYTRIVFVDLVKLDKTNPVAVFTTREPDITPDLVGNINAAALASSGALQILPAPEGYLLVKRSPNTAQARYGVALTIDVEKLLENDLGFGPDISLSLSSQGGTPLYHKPGRAPEGLLSFPLTFHKTLGSRSQPLVLDVGKSVPVWDAIPLSVVVPLIVFSALILFVLKAYLDQYYRAKRSEQRALLGEHEARIAQASRINSLGEMASGLAHELTQPLTAILSKSQAGEHLVKRNPEDIETLSDVLGSITQQSKRAGDILLRLRKWTVQETKGGEPVDLNDVARGIKDLMTADLRTRGIDMRLFLHPVAPVITADAVQIEQVVFNLVKNGAESLDVSAEEGAGKEAGTAEKILEISTFVTEDHAVIEVADNGPGIAPDIMSNVLQPFYTTKQQGMGLGLSLCENIVERFQGLMEIENKSSGGVTVSVSFPIRKTALSPSIKPSPDFNQSGQQ